MSLSPHTVNHRGWIIEEQTGFFFSVLDDMFKTECSKCQLISIHATADLYSSVRGDKACMICSVFTTPFVLSELNSIKNAFHVK